ncbi:MAG: DUF4430 domain-containing protein [bacterium]|nr:DUF4430 domain-containing protein [bacterium]
MKRSKLFFLHFALFVLIAATALSCGGCRNATEIETGNGAVTVESIGEGDKSFVLEVVNDDTLISKFTVHTDKNTVGEALLDLGVIKGDNGQYGLYVKTVDGITVDYDKDGAYWAFYVDGQYASQGVDSTEIDEGCKYMLKVER